MPSNVLSIPLKSSPLPSSSLSKALRNHIAESFTDTHPDAFSEDLKEIAVLRESVSRMDAHVANIDAALRYHAQLVFMCSKFPPDVRRCRGEINLSFPWSVSFPNTLPLFNSGINLAEDDSPPGSPSTSTNPQRHAKSHMKISGNSYTIAHPDLYYERSAILFSLAALHSDLGASENRREGESLKRAIASFQTAAGILDYILSDMTPHLSHLSSGPNARCSDADLKPAMLACLREAMLAQAQECFWQKAVVDRLKDATIAKLATRVSDLYNGALDYAANGIDTGDEQGEDVRDAGCELPKEWLNHMVIKKWHFAAAAQYRKSCEDLGANRYGDELGRLRLAESHVKKAMDSPRRGTSDALQADLKSLQGVISSNISRAAKDNDLIYLEPVTPPSSLSPIVAASMVQAKIPSQVSNPIPYLRDAPAPAYGKPLFRELVPYGVHVAISIFEDRKESYMRDEFEMKREELDSMAASALQSLNLPGSLQALDQPMGLPPSLVRKSEELQSEGGLQRLQALAEDVARVSRIDADILRDILSILRQEEVEDANAKQTMSINRDEEQALLFRQKGREFEQTMEQARSSDNVVKDKLREWGNAISILASGYDALLAYIPQQTKAVSMSQSQTSIVRALRVELEGLDDLIDSRASLVEEAKAKSRQHDIRPIVMREAGIIASGSQAPLTIEARHFEPLFDREMQVFEAMQAEVLASEKAQEERLEIIRQCNEDFVESHTVEGVDKKREEALQRMDMTYSKYREISANLTEGLKFYNSLAKLMSELRDSVKQWHWSRRMDIAELGDRLKSTSISSDQSAGDKTKKSAPSPIRPRASVAAGSTPKRTTRSQARAKEDEHGIERQTHSKPTPQTAQAPQWGAWQGGDIRFND